MAKFSSKAYEAARVSAFGLNKPAPQKKVSKPVKKKAPVRKKTKSNYTSYQFPNT